MMFDPLKGANCYVWLFLNNMKQYVLLEQEEIERIEKQKREKEVKANENLFFTCCLNYT